MSKCKITVYITNHNYGNYIERSIESVLKQKFKNFELIIIDDGSTDSSKKIINKYQNHKKVIIIYQKKKGLNVSNNVAIRQAKGEYIIRLDADDWLHEKALKTLYDYLEKNKSVSLVFPDYYEVNEEGKIIHQIKRHNFKKVTLLDQPAHGACCMIRKKCLQEVNYYDENFQCQDGFDLWIKFIKKYKVANINKPLFYYRKHSSSLSSNAAQINKTRSAIFNKNIKKKLKVLAIIATRGTEINPDSYVFKKFKGKKLLDIALQKCLKSKKVLDTLVTTPDKKVINYIKKKYPKKVNVLLRKKHLAYFNTDLSDTLIHSINSMKKKNKRYDAILELSLRAPHLNLHNLDEAINAMQFFNTDMVIGVKKENYDFFSHKGGGLVPLRKSSTLRLERDDIFKNSSAFSLSKINVIKKKKDIYSKIKIGHIILDEVSSMILSDPLSWKIAESVN